MNYWIFSPFIESIRVEQWKFTLYVVICEVIFATCKTVLPGQSILYEIGFRRFSIGYSFFGSAYSTILFPTKINLKAEISPYDFHNLSTSYDTDVAFYPRWFLDNASLRKKLEPTWRSICLACLLIQFEGSSERKLYKIMHWTQFMMKSHLYSKRFDSFKAVIF